MKKLVVVFLALCLLAIPVLADFSEIAVKDAAANNLELKATKGGNYLIKEGGLNFRNNILSAGLMCQAGEYISFHKCLDKDDTVCEELLFADLWMKADESNLLFYKDYALTNTGEYWSTYKCWGPMVPKEETPFEPMTGCAIKIKEGEKVTIQFQEADPDSDKLSTTYDFGAITGRVVDLGNGQFQFNTQVGDAGKYPFKAVTDDGSLTDSTQNCIEVEKINRPPQVRGQTIIESKEGDIVRLDSSCYDPDGDATTIAFAGWMTENFKQTGYDDAGEYTVTVTCTDIFGETGTATLKIVVANRNRPPVITWKQIP